MTYRRFTGGPDPQSRAGGAHAFDMLELESFALIEFRIDDDGVPSVIDVRVSP